MTKCEGLLENYIVVYRAGSNYVIVIDYEKLM